MDQDFSAIEPSLPLFPLSSSTPPPPSSFSQPPPPQFMQAGRPKWNYRLPARYEDVNPEPLPPLEEDKSPTAALPCLVLFVCNQLRMAKNSFGLMQEYLYWPSFDPDSFVPKEDLHQVRGPAPKSMLLLPSPTPIHLNESVEMLMNWKDSGPPTKSDSEVNRLIKDVLLDPNFKLEDL